MRYTVYFGYYKKKKMIDWEKLNSSEINKKLKWKVIGEEPFLSDLDKISKEIEGAFSKISNKEFMVFHPAWGYFADEFGLKQIPIEIEGKEPGPKQLSKIIDLAKEKNINL